MEVGTFQHHIHRRLIGTRAFTSKHSSYTHWSGLIANGKVVFSQNVFFSVQGNKLFPSIVVLHYDMMPIHHVCIKTMHWLSISHHNIVGNVHNVVYWAQTYNVQLVFQPFRTFLNITIRKAQASITSTCFGIFYSDFNGKFVVVYLKTITGRAV